MITVRGDVARVEARLVAGRLRCPDCCGVLAGWGYALGRVIRIGSGVGWRVRPRRARCRSCLVTHVLLPTRCLLRRGWEAAVVFTALRLRAAGKKLAAIAATLGVPVSTVRDWMARCVSRAEALRSGFLRLLPALDPRAPAVEPAHSPLGDVVAAIDAAARAVGVFDSGVRAVSPGELACHLSRARLLAPSFDPESINTSPL